MAIDLNSVNLDGTVSKEEILEGLELYVGMTKNLMKEPESFASLLGDVREETIYSESLSNRIVASYALFGVILCMYVVRTPEAMEDAKAYVKK